MRSSALALARRAAAPLAQARGLGSSSPAVDKTGMRGRLAEYPERKIRIYSCEEVYKRWRKERKYFSIPKSGVYADITYVDTMVNVSESGKGITASSPTVLCIHGIPGNYGVFSHLINEFGNKGVRVIVPNFPDVLYLPGKWRKELFRHSVDEKTQIFKDFLAELKVSQVDAIIAHSSAIYPALRLALDPSVNAKCQILFNTGGHRRTATMNPVWVIWICSYLYLHPWGRKFVDHTGRFILKYILRSPIKDDNLSGIMMLAITMVFSEYWKTKELFQELVKRELPTLLCFSEDDKVVERQLSYEVISLLGATQDNISYYDDNENLIKKGKDKSWLRILSFEKGSHYVFRKHHKICNEEVLNIMKRSILNMNKKLEYNDRQNSNNTAIKDQKQCNKSSYFQKSIESSRA